MAPTINITETLSLVDNLYGVGGDFLVEESLELIDTIHVCRKDSADVPVQIIKGRKWKLIIKKLFT